MTGRARPSRRRGHDGRRERQSGAPSHAPAAPPHPRAPVALQLAAVEMLPAFLEQHPSVRLVVLDSVTFHFRQVRHSDCWPVAWVANG